MTFIEWVRPCLTSFHPFGPESQARLRNFGEMESRPKWFSVKDEWVGIRSQGLFSQSETGNRGLSLWASEQLYSNRSKSERLESHSFFNASLHIVVAVFFFLSRSSPLPSCFCFRFFFIRNGSNVGICRISSKGLMMPNHGFKKTCVSLFPNRVQKIQFISSSLKSERLFLQKEFFNQCTKKITDEPDKPFF